MFTSFIKHLIPFLIPHLLFASNQFEKKIQFGNPSKCQRVICLQDSSYLLTGFVEGAVQSSILCKINSVGDTLWSKQYGVDDYSLDAVMTNDFGFIVVGA